VRSLHVCFNGPAAWRPASQGGLCSYVQRKKHNYFDLILGMTKRWSTTFRVPELQFSHHEARTRMCFLLGLASRMWRRPPHMEHNDHYILIKLSIVSSTMHCSRESCFDHTKFSDLFCAVRGLLNIWEKPIPTPLANGNIFDVLMKWEYLQKVKFANRWIFRPFSHGSPLFPRNFCNNFLWP
jgi:hypothetical protein